MTCSGVFIGCDVETRHICLSTNRCQTMSLVYDDIFEITRDPLNLILWLQEKGVIGDFARDCVPCLEGKLTLKRDSSYGKDGFVWRCTKKECGYKISIRAGSWFENSHLTLQQVVKLTYYWVYKTRQETVKRELKISCDETVVDWYNFCREVCSEVIEKENVKVGGPGKVVEIDESKFGKRKYHKGRRKDGVWVFGGIERETKNCFLTSVEDRSADTLVPIIKQHVLPGTIIISDCWKAYSRLTEEGYVHQTVNHSKEFVNRETGAHTNTIESTWRAVKTSLPKHGTVKSLYDTYFVEYIFRRRYLNDAEDPFLAFLDNIKKVYSPNNSKRLNPPPRPIVKRKEPTETAAKRPALLPLINILNMSSDDDFQ